MKVVISREKLKEAKEVMKQVSAFSDKKSSIPALTGMMIEAKEGVVTVRCTNLESGIEGKFEAEVAEEGKVVVNAVKISELVANSEEVEMELEGNRLKVKTEDSVFKLPVISDGEEAFNFGGEREKIAVIPQESLKEGIESVIFAVSNDEARYILTGVCLNFREEISEVAGTDGKVLAVYEFGKVECKEYLGVIPKKFAKELTKILGTEGEVEIKADDSRMEFRTEKYVVWSSLIEGEYPDYSALFPEEFTTDIDVHKGEMVKALKKVSVVMDKGETEFGTFECAEDKLTVKVEVEGSEAITNVPCKCYRKTEFTASIPRMLECISAFNLERVELNKDEEKNALYFYGDEPLYIVMALATK